MVAHINAGSLQPQTRSQTVKSTKTAQHWQRRQSGASCCKVRALARVVARLMSLGSQLQFYRASSPLTVGGVYNIGAGKNRYVLIDPFVSHF